VLMKKRPHDLIRSSKDARNYDSVRFLSAKYVVVAKREREGGKGGGEPNGAKDNGYRRLRDSLIRSPTLMPEREKKQKRDSELERYSCFFALSSRVERGGEREKKGGGEKMGQPFRGVFSVPEAEQKEKN